MRSRTLASAAGAGSVMSTSWPAAAKTWAMPCPMRPAPMTLILAFAISRLSRRVAAIRVEYVAGLEIGSARGEEEKGVGEILRLAEALPGSSARSADLDLPRAIHALAERGSPPKLGRQAACERYGAARGQEHEPAIT